MMDSRVRRIADAVRCEGTWSQNEWGGADVTLAGGKVVRLTMEHDEFNLIGFAQPWNQAVAWTSQFTADTPHAVILAAVQAATVLS